jgi:hypothetical protein
MITPRQIETPTAATIGSMLCGAFGHAFRANRAQSTSFKDFPMKRGLKYQLKMTG